MKAKILVWTSFAIYAICMKGNFNIAMGWEPVNYYHFVLSIGFILFWCAFLFFSRTNIGLLKYSFYLSLVNLLTVAAVLNIDRLPSDLGTMLIFPAILFMTPLRGLELYTYQSIEGLAVVYVIISTIWFAISWWLLRKQQLDFFKRDMS